MYQFSVSKWILIPFLIILIAYSGLFLDPTQPLKFFLLSIFCFAGNISIIKHISKNKEALIKSSFFLIYGIYILSCIVSLVYTNSLKYGIYECLKIALYFNFFVIGLYYLKDKGKISLTQLAYFFSIFQFIVIAGILYSLLTGNLETNWFDTKPYGGFFINPNLSSQVLFLTFPFVIFSIIYTKNKLIRNIQVAILCLSILVIAAFGSTTIIIALLAFIVGSVLLWIISSKKLSSKSLLSILFTLTIIATVTIYKALPEVSKRNSIQDRKELWIRTVNMIKDAPIVGQGIGSWRINNPNYTPTKEVETKTYDNSSIYDPRGLVIYERPHNDFLWIWSELGVLGLLSYLALFSLAFYYGIKLIRSSDKKDQVFYSLCMSALFAFMTISFLSFPKERITQSLLLNLYFIFIVGAYQLVFSKKSFTIKQSKIIFYALLFISSFSIYWSFSRLKSDYHTRNALLAKEKIDWYTVISELKKAQNVAYDICGNGTPINMYKGIAQINLGQAEKAHQSFKKAFQAHPTHLLTINNLATIYAVKNNTDTAILYYDKALKINPHYEDARISLSGVYYNTGKFKEAWKVIKRVTVGTKHTKYQSFVNAIIEAQFKEDLNKTAIEKYSKEKIESYYRSNDLVFFNMYRISTEQSIPMNEVILEELVQFKQEDTTEI